MTRPPSLRIEIHPAEQLGSERECLELLQIGSLSMTKVSAAVLENNPPSFQLSRHYEVARFYTRDEHTAVPVAVSLGIDPVHFGIVMVMNLCIGVCTPPVGTVLFVGCGVAGVTIGQVVRPLLPLCGAMVATLLVVTFVPGLSLWLPRWLDVVP